MIKRFEKKKDKNKEVFYVFSIININIIASINVSKDQLSNQLSIINYQLSII